MQMKYLLIITSLLALLPSASAAPLLDGPARSLIALAPFIVAVGIFLFVAFFLRRPVESSESFNTGLMEVMIGAVSAIIVFIIFAQIVDIFLGLTA